MVKYSIIIAVYNRPEELKELLDSLVDLSYKNFEVLVVEDGSTIKSDHLIPDYEHKLNLKYFFKENTGQGFSRNFAAEKALGEYLVFLDSDCLVPKSFFDAIENRMEEKNVLFWGGPDKAHKSFSYLQKSISFTMTSVLTTGGIRGKKVHAGNWQPRSFNMGIRRDIFLENKGFYKTNLGEDIELSTRLFNQGVKAELIEEAFVFHKRRNTIPSFFRQAYSFGKGRVLNSRRNKGALKLVHWFPLVFTVGLLSLPFIHLVNDIIAYTGYFVYGLYFIMMIILGSIEGKNPIVGFLSCITAVIQLVGYGVGFIVTMFSKTVQ